MRTIFAFLLIFCSIQTAYAQRGTLTCIACGGSSAAGCSGDGGPAATAMFGYPSDFCTDRHGNVYIADQNCNSVRKINNATGIIDRIAGTGTSGYSGDGGAAVAAQIGVDVYLSTDTAGNIFIADVDNHRIRRIDASTGIITTVAGGGSSAAYGVSATSVALVFPSNLFVARSGDIYFLNGGMLAKIQVGSGIIDTVVCPSCGGVGIAFSGFGNYKLTGDSLGNLYYIDNDHVYKLDTAFNRTLIAGAGQPPSSISIYGWHNEAAPATNVQIRPTALAVDDTGNVYIANNDAIQRISHTSGLINTVAGKPGINSYATGSYIGLSAGADTVSLPADDILIGRGGHILVLKYGVQDIDRSYSNIDTAGVSDSFVTPRNQIPTTIACGVHGTLTETPGATDSAHITVYFGDGTSKDTVTPYWRRIVGSDTTYGFGNNYSWIGNHTYTYPGQYQIYYRVTTLNDYNIVLGDTTILVRSTATSNLRNFRDTAGYATYSGYFVDSIITGRCTIPAQMRMRIRGWVAGVPSTTDTIYYKIHLNAYSHTGPDSVLVRKGLVSLVPIIDTFSGDTLYEFNYQEILNYDTSLVQVLPYVYDHGANSVEFAMNNGIVINTRSVAYNPFPIPFGSYRGFYTSVADFYLNNCGYAGLVTNNIDNAHSGFSCSVPYTTTFISRSFISGALLSSTSDSFRVNFGDGTDTTYLSTHFLTDGMGNFYFSDSFTHTYTVPGNYSPRIMALHIATDTSYLSSPVSISSGCNPVTGTFYIDSNATCSLDAGEVKLAYWPYVLINNTRADTTYGWCDDTGGYALTVFTGDSYTMISNAGSYGFYGAAGATLAPSCPATGVYTFTATSGTTTHDFAFTCVSAPTMDMNVAGWGWGFVPSDTGVVGIWSSNPWGFMCDTLSSTITLVLDTNLTYAGMWSGPAPTSISGDTLRWNFATAGSLFDFNGYVKVVTHTTATVFDTIRNYLYVAPTRITDPDMSNNTYNWHERVRASWDPNEKQVSPQGYGSQGYIPNGTPLSYIVHFQNTGSAPARNITLSDTISNHLDLVTLQVISSSSPVLVYHSGNVVKFRFNDINLPDSASNPTGSVGYIAYNIVPKDSLAAGTQIVNKAGIYFDYNPAVYTNTTLNTIEDTIGRIYGPDSVCIGATITLTNHITGGVWSATNVRATVSTSGVATGVSIGLDTIRYVAYGHLEATKVVYVKGTPGASLLSGSSTVCAGTTTPLAATISGGTWSHFASGIATVSATGVVSGLAVGIDTIYYMVSNSCGSGTSSFAISVITVPSPGAISGTDSVCVANTVNLTCTGSGGSWSSSNAAVATVSIAGAVTGVSAGVVTVSYTVSNSCGPASAVYPFTVHALTDCPTGIAAVVGDDDFAIFPNPNNGSFLISLPVHEHNVIITITDVAGQLVHSMTLLNNKQLEVPVNVSQLAAGVYMVKAEVDGQVYRRKIVVM